MTAVGKQVSTIVQLAPIGPITDELLATEFQAVRLWELSAPEDWLRRFAQDVQVIVTSVRKGCDAATMDRFPKLGAICSWGVGFDTIDVAYATARGIQVSVTPDVLNDCVADLAWSLLLSTARKIVQADNYVRAGRWRKLGEFPLSTKVSGKRLGILGLGRIGAAIAMRGEGFGMSVAYHSRRPVEGVPYGYEPTLSSLADWADFLVVACPGGDQTRHLVTLDVLEKLGPRGIVINIARGSVIDTEGLRMALERGLLGGAGLDVIEGEPGVPDWIRERDDVVLTPHVGSATIDTRQDMEHLVLENVRSFLHSGKVKTPA